MPIAASTSRNVFADYQDEAYPWQFAVTLHIDRILGGIPSDPHVAEGWIRTKLGTDKDEIIRDLVNKTMEERGISAEEATKEVNLSKHLNGFKRDEDGLFIEGRQVKSAIKEAASVALAAAKLETRYGITNKGVLSFVAEHIIVVEDRIYLGAAEPAGVLQSFPKNPITKQTGIQYTEYVDDTEVSFTVISDWPFSEQEWAMIWLTGGQQGLGASRSQGYGRYRVTEFRQLPTAYSDRKPTRTRRPTPAKKTTATN